MQNALLAYKKASSQGKTENKNSTREVIKQNSKHQSRRQGKTENKNSTWKW